MNTKFKSFAEQALIVFNIFIAFLLLFEDKLVLPFWLQSVGRMHPVMLHFPLVILILAIAIELYRFTWPGKADNTVKKFAEGLLLTGALLAGITVMMGVFLAKEQGYSGDTLAWHKWTGCAVFFIASIIYWLRNKRWYKSPMAWVSAMVIVAVLISAGHLGANLTHGENFISQPITSNMDKPIISLEQAVVFKDVIEPILNAKCAGCHNAVKLKGELKLTDSLSILKGGKTGKLFVPGNPDISLLLQRVHLPMDEEEHMPPKGKPQLTDAEMVLLSLWVKENAAFSQKLTALPEGDSLRVMATAILQPNGGADETYNFEAADKEIIAKLNTDYRSITPVAEESPALDVDIYNKDAYSAKQLQELTDIKKQVVEISLNKLPVKDDDLKIVSQFTNLRRLELNATDVTANGLETLSPLSHLHTLSLSGTKIIFNDLKAKLPALKALKTLTVWNTGLSVNEVAQLRAANKSITFIEGFRDTGNNPLKLNPPQVKNSEMVFASNLAVQLRHPIRGVTIRYTTDGTDPDSVKSQVFDGNLVINKKAKIKARACKEGWYASDIVTFDFLKNSFIPDSVQLLNHLSPVHQAEGANTFFNKILGAIGANNGAWANHWAGTGGNTDIVLVSLFYKPITIGTVGIHFMLEEETGIYPPEKVEIWGGDNEKDAKLLATIKPSLPIKGKKPTLEIAETSFKPHKVSYLKIIAKPGKEKMLLIDEMFLD